MRNFRWLAVGPAGQEDVSVVLMAIPGAPIMDPQTAQQVRDVMAKGFAGTIFLTTDDCRAARVYAGTLPPGSIPSMAKEKVTITVDRATAEAARRLVGAASTSEVIAIALERLVRGERLRRDVGAYRRLPQIAAEQALADEPATDGLRDDVDCEALHADAGYHAFAKTRARSALGN